MIAAAVLCFLQTPPALPAPPDRAVLEIWRESIELDVPAEVIEKALPRVSAGGDLARDGEAIALVARALAAAGDEVRAAELLAGSKPSEASRGFVEVARGRLALDRDDLAGAKKILIAAPGEDPAVAHPAIPECWLLAGRTLARSGERAQAVPFLERFLAMAPLDVEAPAAWHMLVQAAIERGEEAKAADLRAKALASSQWQGFYRTRRIQVRENPGEPLPRLGIAELFLAAGEHARAREACRDLTARFPDFCRGFGALGRAQRALGELEPARKSLERAVECDPQASRAFLDLARSLAALGESEAAAARYARYRELGGTEPLEER